MCLWGGGSAWVGHVYGCCVCTHGGCCATQSMGGVVVTTSSSIYKLVVCGGTRKMEPVDVKCMQKRCQTRFNHAMAPDDDVRSYSFQLAATRIETVLCDCTKLSY